nr:MAG TPA: DNA primase [Caudoviricetes sp.]
MRWRMSDGYPTHEDIMERYSQEYLFHIALGFTPHPGQKICSPLREDNHPGCSIYLSHGVMLFKDHAVDWPPLDAVDLLMYRLRIYSTVELMEWLEQPEHQLEKGVILGAIEQSRVDNGADREVTRIVIQPRVFNSQDGHYWGQFGIASMQLRQDGVFPVASYRVLGGSGYENAVTPQSLCYAYTRFRENRMKLYFPMSKRRFLSTCRADDIGYIEPMGNSNTLIITKSYKDCRVLINCGFHAIWLQNEGCIPSRDAVVPYLQGYRKAFILFDNDTTGMSAAAKLLNRLGVTGILHLDSDCKDSAEHASKYGCESLRNILTERIRQI